MESLNPDFSPRNNLEQLFSVLDLEGGLGTRAPVFLNLFELATHYLVKIVWRHTYVLKKTQMMKIVLFLHAF